MQLYTASSAAITSGFIGSGRFGVPLAKDKIEDLGNSVDCLPVAWRFKAMKFGEAVISVYNPQSKQFKDIQNTADEVPDSGCSYGLEFLVWLPSLKQFVTYFMNSKTSRLVAPEVKDRLGTPITIRSNLIKKGSRQWHGPVVSICSTPFEAPNQEDLLTNATKFANPKESEVEEAEQTSSRAQ